jgi:hypothetical protein
MSTITPIEPLQLENPDAGPSAVVTVFLGFCCMIYFMYDYFDKRLVSLNDRNIETEARFHIVEDKLATLNELEENVRQLAEADEERKSSWEDDITEPSKYQAILGTGTFEGTQYEFRFVREKLDTFKSNRYWLLNDISSNSLVIQHILQHYFTQSEVDKRGIEVEPILFGLDSRLSCSLIVRTEDSGIQNLQKIIQEAKKIEGGSFKWKRALLDER